MVIAAIRAARMLRGRVMPVPIIPVAWVKRRTRIVGAAEVVDHERTIIRVLVGCFACENPGCAAREPDGQGGEDECSD